jgi:outer membrane receptor protein involved in Fe transport
MIMPTPLSEGIRTGLFANATIGFKNMIYLDLSGRNDKSSILSSTSNLSNFSHSIGLSGIISQMVSFPWFITFGKVRGSYATVANEAPYDDVAHSVGQPIPFNGVKPEMFKSIELGTDWIFFEGRLGIDFTWYRTNITDLFFVAPTLYGTAFPYIYMNTGKMVNKGIELTIDTEPISTASFSWRTAINYAHNKNEVTEVGYLTADRPIWLSLGSSESYHSRIAAGGSFGDLYAFDFARDGQGRIIINAVGRPTRTQELEHIGSINPDFTLGWHNTFSYKNFSM